jgi:hypothetical protein
VCYVIDEKGHGTCRRSLAWLAAGMSDGVEKIAKQIEDAMGSPTAFDKAYRSVVVEMPRLCAIRDVIDSG